MRDWDGCTGGLGSSRKQWRATTRPSGWTNGKGRIIASWRNCMWRKVQVAKAIERLKDAKELEPESADCDGVGERVLAGKRYAEAAPEFQELLEAAPAMGMRCGHNRRRRCAGWDVRPKPKHCLRSRSSKHLVAGRLKATQALWQDNGGGLVAT
jgi:hypothetical protein